MDNSSVESASICPLSDSESSDVSVCPYHGHKYMNHLPVLHEVYNLDSDDSSVMSPAEGMRMSTGTMTNSSKCPVGLVGDDESPLPPVRNQLHTWRLKTRPMKRSNAVCLSDEYKTSSGEDSPCLCGGNNNPSIATYSPLSSSNNKVDDSGIELMESFDMQCAAPSHSNDKLLQVTSIKNERTSGGSGGIVHRSIQTDEDIQCGDDTETECSEINVPLKKVVGTNTISTSPLHPPPTPSPPTVHSHHIIQQQLHHHPSHVRRPQATKYDSLCSTVTTFGVYPESTSTDV